MRTLGLVLVLLSACGGSSDSDPLTGAVRAGDVAATAALLQHGADPNRPAGVNDWPPLMHAVHKNQLGTAETLLEHGADVDRGDPNGVTPLMMAAGYGNNEMVALLLRHHANSHVRAHDGATALDFALTGTSDIDKFTLLQCQSSTVALLLRAGPDVKPQRSSKAFAAAKRCV